MTEKIDTTNQPPLRSTADAAAYLRKMTGGVIDYAPSTLDRKRADGSGPRYVRIKNTPFYREDALNDFIETEIGAEFTSTAEENDARHRAISEAISRRHATAA